mmetsp:Transcript_44087/g.82445  ORF Transcript_44087/g.82445 Transcript_44087/m.82445 type:complete len:88 (+) Transcript_44087:146-409(+)
MWSFHRLAALCALLASLQAVSADSDQCSTADCLNTQGPHAKKPVPQASFGLGAKPKKGAKQHSLLQLKTTLSKVVLPPEDDDSGLDA